MPSIQNQGQNKTSLGNDFQDSFERGLDKRAQSPEILGGPKSSIKGALSAQKHDQHLAPGTVQYHKNNTMSGRVLAVQMNPKGSSNHT